MRLPCTCFLVAFLIFASESPAQRDQQNERQDQPARTISCRTIRLIEDSSTHVRWMLSEDIRHPALPARLMRVTDGFSCGQPAEPDTDPSDSASEMMHTFPIIHAGDALTVVQHTPVAEVHLEAIALGPAAVGQTLRVRMKSNSQVLSARAADARYVTLSADKIEARW